MVNSRDDATGLLDAFADYAPPPSDDRPIKLGVVASAQTTTGTCTILFDGETIVGAKKYPCLASYTPKVGNRVVVVPAGSSTSWLVIGALGVNSNDLRFANQAGPILQSPNGTWWKLGVTDAGAATFTAV